MTSARAARVAAHGVLALLVLGAALVRRTELGPPALWADDARVALISRHPWPDIWFTSLTSVGFRALVGVAIAPFPEATLAAQALPFLFGLAVIPATYALARRLDLHRAAALLAAGLTAASPLLAAYATRVKQYTGDALFTVAIAASVRWVLRAPSSAGRWWTLAGVSCAAIVFSSQLVLAVGPAVAVAVAGS